MSDVTGGRCLCGNLQFELRGRRLWVAHCHCDSCRRNTGSAIATFVGYRKEQLTYTRGERRFYQSSPGVRRGFCGDCGTPMTYEADRCPDEVHLYISTINNPAAFKPQLHVFFAERIPWMELADDLPRYDGLTPEAEPASWGPLHGGASGDGS